MKIHLDIRNDISPTIALECVKQVIIQGKVSANGESYCYATAFDTNEGEVNKAFRPNSHRDCFFGL